MEDPGTWDQELAAPMESETEARETGSEQLLYAKVLEIGMYIGLVVLFITFAMYVSGILAPAVPLDRVSDYWERGVHEYLEGVNHDYLHMEHPPTGWAWVKMLGKGDFINFVGIAILGGITIICYLAIVPVLLQKKDYAYLIMAVLEALVLGMAASGILAVGH
ncbi:MAG: hypothetical protein ACFFEM_11995 [Candidatus Thorarchaeota archaeon]